jgi:hypothetical protein
MNQIISSNEEIGQSLGFENNYDIIKFMIFLARRKFLPTNFSVILKFPNWKNILFDLNIDEEYYYFTLIRDFGP